LLGGTCSALDFRRPRPVVNRERGIDCNLPPKPTAQISESAGILGAENNFTFRQEGDHKILAIALHRYSSPRDALLEHALTWAENWCDYGEAEGESAYRELRLSGAVPRPRSPSRLRKLISSSDLKGNRMKALSWRSRPARI
jgi:hypothetical protein